MMGLEEKREIQYNGYPIVFLKDKCIIYDIQNGEVISAKKEHFKNIINSLRPLEIGTKKWDSSFPKINFCLTFKCNLACDYCAVSANLKEGDISEKMINSVFKKYVGKEAKKIKINFTGGEPTICMDKIKYIVEKVRKRGLDPIYVINTNGLINKKDIDYLIYNKFKFFVSIDGLQEIHNTHRKTLSGEGSFDKVIKTLKYLIENGAIIVPRATVTKESLNGVVNLVEFLGKLGIKIFRIANVTKCGRAKRKLIIAPSAKEYGTLIKKCGEIAKKYKMGIISSQYINLFSPSINSCITMAGGEIIIAPNGNITTCFAVYRKEDFMGDYFIIGKYDSLTDEIIIDREKQKRVQGYNVNNFNKCSECFCKYICSAGCPLLHSVNGNNNEHETINKKYCNYVKNELRTLIEGRKK